MSPGAPVELPDFDGLYRADGDPWQVESSWYERRKLAVTLAALPRESYASAWEPGCGPGFVSRRLSERAGHLLSTDSSAVAIEQARARCGDLDGVRFEVADLADPPGESGFDLIVVAEFLYYVEAMDQALASVWERLAPGGHLVVVHWAHRPHDAFRSGLAMHAAITADAEGRGAAHPVEHLDADFRLDVFEAAR